MEWATSYDPDASISVLKVAVDESGTHKEATALCVAACVATSRQWGLFVRDWSEISKGRIPKGRRYHAKERWCERGGLNDDMARLIGERMDYSFAVTISDEDYKASASHRFRSTFGSSYATAVYWLMTMLSHKLRYGGKLAYVIEAGHAKHEKVMALLQRAIAHPEFRDILKIRSAVSAYKDESILLPADFMAHEVAGSYESGGEVPDRIARLFPEKLGYSHLDPETIREAVKGTWAAWSSGP